LLLSTSALSPSVYRDYQLPYNKKNRDLLEPLPNFIREGGLEWLILPSEEKGLKKEYEERKAENQSREFIAE